MVCPLAKWLVIGGAAFVLAAILVALFDRRRPDGGRE
jgi:hypothetical protein